MFPAIVAGKSPISRLFSNIARTIYKNAPVASYRHNRNGIGHRSLVRF